MTRFIYNLLINIILLSVSFNALGLTVCGHRGARGLVAENTLPAFERALKEGVDVVDLDVVMTRDGVLVAYHDLTLNPDLTRDSKGRWIKRNDIGINSLTLKQLKTYDVGRIKPGTTYAQLFSAQQALHKVPIPTLKEVIHDVKKKGGKNIQFQIELKTDPTKPDLSPTPEKMVHALIKILQKEHIVTRTRVQAYDWRCLQLLQRLSPQITTAYLTDLTQEKQMKDPNPNIAGLWTAGYLLKDYQSIPHMIKALGGRAWDAQDIEVSQAKIREAHQLGLKVNVWSWSEKMGKDIDILLVKKLLTMNVDGIITDRPDVVLNLIHAYKKLDSAYV